MFSNNQIEYSKKKIKYICKVINGNKNPIISSLKGRYKFFTASKYPKRIDFDGGGSSYEKAIILSSRGYVGKIIQLVENEYFDLTSSAIALKEFSDQIDVNYLFYWLRCYLFSYLEKNSLINKTVISYVTAESIKNIELNLPVSLEHQRKIAKYLKEKDQLINRLIDAYKAEIESIEKVKKSLVKKYLVDMDIDKELKIHNIRKTKIKYLSRVEIGIKSTLAGVFEGRYKFFTNAKEPKRINFDGSGTYKEAAIVLAGRGNVGEIVNYVEGECFDHGVATILISHFGENVYWKYLFYWLDVNFFDYLKKYSLIQKTVISFITTNTVKNIELYIPEDIEHQKRVVDFLDEKINNLDKLIEHKKKNIEILKRYWLEVMKGVIKY